MYIRICNNMLRDDAGRRAYPEENKAIIVPVSEPAEQPAHNWSPVSYPVFYDGKIYFVRSSPADIIERTRLLANGDTIKIKNKGNTIYTVLGGGKVMYRAQDSDGNVIRRNYYDKNGDLTFAVYNEEPPAINVVESAGFTNFLNAVKTNSRYDSEELNGGIYKNYAAAVEAKSRLRDILSKHPNWNESQQCVETVVDIVNKPNGNEIMNKCDELFEEICTQKIFNASTINECFIVKDCLRYSSNYTTLQAVMKLRDNTATRLKRLSSLQDVNFEQKASRVTSAIMTVFGVERNHEIERKFAAYADTLSLKTQRYKLVLSINPTDFITMSHGNSWRSCHSFEHDGCFHSGCLSYALDKNTMIAYIIPEDTEGDYCNARKIKRLLYMLSNDGKGLMSTKMYPDNSDNGAREAFDNAVVSMFNALNENRFTPGGYKEVYSHGRHYPDYNYGFYNLFSINSEIHRFDIGAQAYAFDRPYDSTMYENTCLNMRNINKLSELVLETQSIREAFEEYTNKTSVKTAV